MIFQYLLELSFSSWLIGIFLVLLLIDLIKNKNPPSFPPGPRPLPFVGNIFSGLDFPTIDKLADKYGEVFSLRLGFGKTVFVSGYKNVKEALVMDTFVDRPDVPLFYKIFKGLSVGVSNGYLWKMQRKFAITHLRHFGEAKKDLELSMQQETTFLCDAFRDEKGPFDPQIYLNSAVSNIISALVFGHRFEYHDEHFYNILRLDTEAISLAFSAGAQLYNFFPSLFEHLPGTHQKVFSNYNKITSFISDEVKKHKEKFDPSNPRDYIDAFLLEIEKNNDPDAGFNIETLIVSSLEMFEAGSETTATTLRWGFLYMMKYPEIQKKVQEEIDRVIGQSRQPCMADKPNMPYTEAVVHEMQRVGNVVPLGFPKKAIKDTTLGGYFIPKGTTVNTNLSSVLNDKTEWKTPDTFNPEHFLDDQGQFRKRDAFLPFSAGRRVCVGESLARMELFLFFTSLLQNFTFTPGPGKELTLEGQMGFTYAPSPYSMCVNPR
uniref:Cytochrome P450 2J2-like n=1 Tax=Astyanax mexicanus TaxID=7994 RepID=A0A8B9JLP5_ASTMX